ncbi:UDP-glycosyltransferase 83A1-like [Salvia miltiorrhiza]|uniref:UDP-glycosyltransferase 83A1-like n=1 Tax=Salvia miltiorrhiza TaxID=226208 RepID=UPI0025ABF82D|nr:UDP-glycosyltransferase 83A1-like [Salvia miltiorrhiza]
MGRPHVIAVPYPAQGHVIPLLELAQCLADNGIKVTFVNTDFNHTRILNSLPRTRGINELIILASVPDGLEPWEDRNDLGKLEVSLPKAVPRALEALIEKINATESDKVTCLITDYGLIWALALAEKLGIKKSAFLPAPVALLALANHAKSLLDEGIVDSDGTPMKVEHVTHLSPEMPPMKIQETVWLQMGDFASQQRVFQSMARGTQAEAPPDWIVCNTSHELEAGALKLLPNLVPLGPLLPSTRLGHSAGFFWPEDSASMSWLDQQPANSTIYVAFGSFTMLDEKQFQELALGLEHSRRPFLWVVRQDMAQDYPKGFRERVRNQGKMVGWAPQQKVLSHPSLACFLSHCGWNSTVEGVCGGVPFLCWPYFADQFLNQSYIAEYWRVGLSLDKDEFGIVTSGEIVKKVEILLSDESYKARVMSLGSKTVSSVTQEGGSSHKNLNSFVDWIKEK